MSGQQVRKIAASRRQDGASLLHHRRYSRTAGGTTTQFIYGPGGTLLEKQGANYTAAYTYGNGLHRREGEYPLFDGHGSERTVTNSGQTVTGTANYEAFGQVAGSSGSSSSPYMYAGDWGYRNDGDAGLMHVGARYYDAQVGRFVTRDTVLSEHPYVYCEGDPVGFVDPSGHQVYNVPGYRDILNPGMGNWTGKDRTDLEIFTYWWDVILPGFWQWLKRNLRVLVPAQPSAPALTDPEHTGRGYGVLPPWDGGPTEQPYMGAGGR